MIGGHFDDLGSVITSTVLETGGQLLSEIISEHGNVWNWPFLSFKKSEFSIDAFLFEIELRIVSFVEISFFMVEICTNDDADISCLISDAFDDITRFEFPLKTWLWLIWLLLWWILQWFFRPWLVL